MTGSDALDGLARLAGIEDGWWDFFGQWRPVPAETKRAFLAAMGFVVDDEVAVLAAAAELETRPWRRWLEPVVVLGEHDAPELAVTLPATRDRQMLDWRLEEEIGVSHSGTFQVDTLRWREERWLDGQLVKRWTLPLPEMPPLGYHSLRLHGPDGEWAETTLIVTPARAFVPAAVEDGHGAWGVATQVYALRSPGDWGVGTYAALERLAEGAARLGAASVGINPLHALFPEQPDRFSPYAPSSRGFLNTAYVDVEAIPEFAGCTAAQRAVAAPEFQARLAAARNAALVDYPAVAALARPVLRVLYRRFRDEHLDRGGDARGEDFRRFQAEGGRTAELFCTFEALHERFAIEGNGYWRHWPEEYRHPDSPAVAAFADSHRERVDFFWWLQFVADEQVCRAHQAGLAAGAGIGLYRDLGVGIAGDGADSWMEQGTLAAGVSVGAPPDPLAPKGQDWGLMPFDPLRLREAAYAPFIGMIRANMRHAGALRLDHAMSLQRLYWVPPGADADQGAYVRYPVDDLFALVALESRRNTCLVIGEDLGTVPDGFRERMGRMGIFAYRVMVFEKGEDQEVRRPEAFDEQALAIFATHDLPSLRGWWAGRDIMLREELDLFPRPDMAAAERDGRGMDRRKMVAALAGEELLPADFPAEPVLTDAQADTLATAAHAYLARARSRLMMVQIEDVLGMDSQMNLPGTTVEHPNWRGRFPAEVDAILADPRLAALAGRLREGRPPPNFG